MSAANPSVWSVLLPVIVGAATASVVPVVLALLNRRWSLRDEMRRDSKRLGEAQQGERKAALRAYLHARSEYATCCINGYGLRHSGQRTGHGTPHGEAIMAASTRCNLSVNDAFVLWGREGARLVGDDIRLLAAWHKALMATPPPDDLDGLPPIPSISDGLGTLLDLDAPTASAGK